MSTVDPSKIHERVYRVQRNGDFLTFLSNQGEIIRYNLNASNQPPTITATFTGNGTITGNGTSQAKWTVTATDPDPAPFGLVKKLEYSLDNGNYVELPISPAKTVTASTPTFTLTDGNHSIIFRATDQFGAQSVTSVINFLVNNSLSMTVTATPNYLIATPKVVRRFTIQIRGASKNTAFTLSRVTGNITLPAGGTTDANGDADIQTDSIYPLAYVGDCVWKVTMDGGFSKNTQIVKADRYVGLSGGITAAYADNVLPDNSDVNGREGQRVVLATALGLTEDWLSQASMTSANTALVVPDNSQKNYWTADIANGTQQTANISVVTPVWDQNVTLTVADVGPSPASFNRFIESPNEAGVSSQGNYTTGTENLGNGITTLFIALQGAGGGGGAGGGTRWQFRNPRNGGGGGQSGQTRWATIPNIDRYRPVAITYQIGSPTYGRQKDGGGRGFPVHWNDSWNQHQRVDSRGIAASAYLRVFYADTNTTIWEATSTGGWNGQSGLYSDADSFTPGRIATVINGVNLLTDCLVTRGGGNSLQAYGSGNSLILPNGAIFNGNIGRVSPNDKPVDFSWLGCGGAGGGTAFNSGYVPGGTREVNGTSGTYGTGGGGGGGTGGVEPGSGADGDGNWTSGGVGGKGYAYVSSVGFDQLCAILGIAAGSISGSGTGGLVAGLNALPGYGQSAIE